MISRTDPQLLAALDRIGVRAEWRSWDDPSAPWDSTPAVLRATWDYTHRRGDFLAWTRSVPRLFNAAAVVVWNSDKVYLHELAAAGVPITPTHILEPGEAVRSRRWRGRRQALGRRRLSRRRAVHRADAAAAEHAATLHAAGRTVLCSPTSPGSTRRRDGARVLRRPFTHAVRKGPMVPPARRTPCDSDALYVEEDSRARTRPRPSSRSAPPRSAFLQERFGTSAVRAGRPAARAGRAGRRRDGAHRAVAVPVVRAGAVDRFAAAIAQRL